MKTRTSEELSLLISYLALIGIWFAIPSVNLLINRDKRWPFALAILIILVLFLLICYWTQWRVLFPQSAALVGRENLELADYDKIKQCRCHFRG
jgi:hypothetical protein